MNYRIALSGRQGPYAVEFCDTIESAANRLRNFTSTVVIADRKVVELHGARLRALWELPTLTLDATEETKTLPGVARVLEWLQAQGCTKDTLVIAIGGGIIQDICAFASHVYYRGIRWAFLPTTLLAMSDSCIGAKCGINLNSYKNQLGVFHAPSEILICPEFLGTLGDQEIASGYGEILKLAITGSQEHLDRLVSAVVKDGLRGPDLPRLIFDSLTVKKTVVDQDEYESDYRRILNYGHTFGHSLERLTEHEVPHGLAVAWGIDLANFIAIQRGLLDRSHWESVHAFIREHLPFRLSRKIDAAAIIRGAKRDKKVDGDSINLILCRRPGDLQIVKTSFDASLERDVAEYIGSHNVFCSA